MPGKPEPPPPQYQELPDFNFEVQLLEEQNSTDPIWVFAIYYIRTKQPGTAFRMAYGDRFTNEECIQLGNAILNSPEVQVALAEIYHAIGLKLNISKEVLVARLWQEINNPALPAKDVAKLMELAAKITNNVGAQAGDDGDGNSAPSVVVNVMQVGHSQEEPMHVGGGHSRPRSAQPAVVVSMPDLDELRDGT